MQAATAGVAERDRDLVQVGDDVADPVEPVDGAALMVVDFQVTLPGMFGPKRHREMRAHLLTHHRVDHLELRRPAAFEDGFDAVVSPPQAHAGRNHDLDTCFSQLRHCGLPVILARCEQRHVAGVAAQEQRLAGGTVNRTDDSDTVADRLEGVADRTIAQQPVRDRGAPFVERRMGVDDTAGKDDGGGRMHVAIPDRLKTMVVPPQGGDLGGHPRDRELVQLRRHACHQVGAGQAVDEARHVVTARDQRRPACACVHDTDTAPKSREVDRGHQPGRAAADDQAIMRLIFPAHLGFGSDRPSPGSRSCPLRASRTALPSARAAFRTSSWNSPSSSSARCEVAYCSM
ncbi:hypothetical protein ACVWW3_003030 [Bradyrhizobium sp. LM2.9]